MTARRTTTARRRRGATESTPHSGDGLQWRAVNTQITKVDVPDDVLNQLAELACIPATVGLWSPRNKFVFDVMNTIRMVYGVGNIFNASTIKRHKEIARCAEELVEHLKATKPERLFAIVSSDTIKAIAGLARGARRAGVLAEAPRQGKWPIKIRKVYVEALLDAAASAGGRLALDRSRQRGSLVDALRLLSPYLPQEGVLRQLSEEWSFSTLRRIYDPWLKNNKNSSKKAKS
jgi:hypothetical protein